MSPIYLGSKFRSRSVLPQCFRALWLALSANPCVPPYKSCTAKAYWLGGYTFTLDQRDRLCVCWNKSVGCYNKSLQLPHFVDICSYITPEIFTTAFIAYLNATTKHQPCESGVFPVPGAQKPESFLPVAPPDPACSGMGFLGT